MLLLNERGKTSDDESGEWDSMSFDEWGDSIVRLQGTRGDHLSLALQCDVLSSRRHLIARMVEIDTQAKEGMKTCVRETGLRLLHETLQNSKLGLERLQQNAKAQQRPRKARPDKAEVTAWEVVHSVNVRKSKNARSEAIGFKTKGTTVYGSQEGDWLHLAAGEPGYMRIIDPADDTMLLITKAYVANSDEGWPAVTPTCKELEDILRGLRQRVSPEITVDSALEKAAPLGSLVAAPQETMAVAAHVENKERASRNRASPDASRSYERFEELPCVAACTGSIQTRRRSSERDPSTRGSWLDQWGMPGLLEIVPGCCSSSPSRRRRNHAGSDLDRIMSDADSDHGDDCSGSRAEGVATALVQDQFSRTAAPPSHTAAHYAL